MTVTVEYAAKHLEELLDTLDSGKSVEILRPDKSVLRISGEVRSPASGESSGKRILGAGKAFSQLPSEEELEGIDREWKREIEEKVIGVLDNGSPAR